MTFLFVATFLTVMPGFPAKADNSGYETLRVHTSTSRCINSKTDDITLSVVRVTVQKTSGFFVNDKTAGIAVISTLNAADPTTVAARTPSVNMVDISGDKQRHRRGRNERVCDTGSNRPAICSSRSFLGRGRY